MKKDAESYYKSLYEVAMVLNSAHAPEVVLQSIVGRLAKVMGAKGCALMLLAPGGRHSFIRLPTGSVAHI